MGCPETKYRDLAPFALNGKHSWSDPFEQKRTLPRQSKQGLERSAFDSTSSDKCKTKWLNFSRRWVTFLSGMTVSLSRSAIVWDKSREGSEILTDFKCLKVANAPSSLRPQINWKTFSKAMHSSNFNPISPRFLPSAITLYVTYHAARNSWMLLWIKETIPTGCEVSG